MRDLRAQRAILAAGVGATPVDRAILAIDGMTRDPSTHPPALAALCQLDNRLELRPRQPEVGVAFEAVLGLFARRIRALGNGALLRAARPDWVAGALLRPV